MVAFDIPESELPGPHRGDDRDLLQGDVALPEPDDTLVSRASRGSAEAFEG